jgi:5'(3')-deoxyribonucleotidase
MLTIAIDIDGTIADLISVWLKEYNLDYHDNLRPSDITAWETHLFVKPECGKSIYTYLEWAEIYDEVLPIDLQNSVVAIERMRFLGHRVVFLTTSTLGASGAKFRWLVKHGFLDKKNMKDYVEATDKLLLRADILIDDKPSTCKAWYESGRFPILFTQPWNLSELVPYMHTNDWEKICDLVEDIPL